MILPLLLAGLIILLWRTPNALISRIIDRAIWVPIARRLMAIERRHLLFWLLMIPVVLLSSELIMMAGSLDAGLIMLWDVSTYVDILVLATISGLSARAKAGWQATRLGIQRAALAWRRTRRPGRAHRARRQRPPSNANDDDRPVVVMMAA